ncbi:MAG: glycosyltransferase family 9 protein, partial [Gammaproteobacteria bacterium]
TSNPLRTGPYKSKEWVVNRYPDAVQMEFAKSVDELRWGERVRNPDAMDLISLDDVRAMIDRFFAASA